MLNLLGLAPLVIKGIIDYKRLQTEREYLQKQQELENREREEQGRQFQEYKNHMKQMAVSGAKANMAGRGINLVSEMAKKSLKSATYNIDRELDNFKTEQDFKTATRNNYYKNLLDKNFYQTLRLPFHV